MKWRRLGEELRGLVVRRHLREVHFSYGTVSLQDVLGVYASGVSSLAPRRGRASSDAKKFERAFAQQLGLPAAFSFGSGRMALYAILRSLGIGPGSEVLVPSFTCVVVPAAVVYAGATPRYVDIERATLNMDVRQLERQVTPRCRAVIAQHTFGRPADMDQILAFAEKHHLFVIEDCAHTIGGAYGDEPLGTIGDAAFFSLELTKPLTSVKGGVAVSRHGWLCERLQMEWSNAPEPSPLETARLWSQLAVYWALYHPNGYWLGKLLLMLLFKSGLYQFSITEAERRGERPKDYPTRLSDFQARLALRQLERLHAINTRRRGIAARYDAALEPLGLKRRCGGQPLLRYPFLVENREHAIRFFREHQIELGQWFNSPLHPHGSDVERFGYHWGDCPESEWAAQHCVNLPTHPALSQSDVGRITDVTMKYLRRYPPLDT